MYPPTENGWISPEGGKEIPLHCRFTIPARNDRCESTFSTIQRNAPRRSILPPMCPLVGGTICGFTVS
jgi:hypothetical protein